jgi:hypothetical protein
MSMTTVAQPTSNAEWHCCSAMAISHSFECGAVASRNLLFYLEGLAHQSDATEDSKRPNFQRSAYSSLFQDKFKVVMRNSEPGTLYFFGAVSSCALRAV